MQMTCPSITYQSIAKPPVDAWGSASKVVDSNGRLLPVFRGQHGPAEHCGETTLGSLSFGSARAASIYAEDPNDRRHVVQAPKVFPVYLDVRNPFVDCADDPFLDFEVYAGIFGVAEAERLAMKFKDQVHNTNAWEDVSADFRSVEELIERQPNLLMQLCILLYPVLDDAEEVSRLRARGFDGAIHAGSGWGSASEVEYRVFSMDQVRSVWDPSLVA
jgi:hypothetical protein